MNTIRPLVTITILIVVGAYLYVKINEGPDRPAGATDVWHSEMPEGVPPLDATAATPEPNAAPPWAASGVATTAAAPMNVAAASANATGLAPDSSAGQATTGVAPGALSSVPPIPDLPVATTMANTGTSTASDSSPIPSEMLQSIPIARYPDDAAQMNSTPSQPFNDAPPSGQSTQIQTVEQTTPATFGNSAASQQPPLSENPLRQTPPAANTDPYASVYHQDPPATSAAAPVEQSFAANWPVIQTALNGRDLSRALQLLSPWHNNPSLTAAEAAQVETLLGQLAGTVVYSTEHQLEPARVVRAGETLETIAKEYNVPWQLLGKINGISAADQVRPGQELKVLRGPFSAVVDLGRNELTLHVDGRYAGKFPVTVPPHVDLPNGEWLVLDKHSSPAGQQPLYAAPQVAVERSLVLRHTEATAANPGLPLLLGTAPSDLNQPTQSTGTQNAQPAKPRMIELSASDANEISDILSIGSRVVIRR
jgi:LysM repeat protein